MAIKTILRSGGDLPSTPVRKEWFAVLDFETFLV